MSCRDVVLDGILWKIVGDLWLLNNFVAAPFLFWSLPNRSSCGLYHIPLGHPWCSEISAGMQVSMECTQWEGTWILHTHLETFVFCNHWVKFSLCKSLMECAILPLTLFQWGCHSSAFLPALWKLQHAVY